MGKEEAFLDLRLRTTYDPKKKSIVCCNKHNKQEPLSPNPLRRLIGEDIQDIFKIPDGYLWEVA